MFSFVLVTLLPSNVALAQPQAAGSGLSQPFVLQDGTPLKLRLNRNLSSADAHTGDQVDFEVLEEVKVNNVLIIPKGANALGTVTEAQAKRRMARGGKLGVNIDYVRLVDGEKAALRAVKEGSGGGHSGAMTGAMVATSLVVWPAAPFFLFMHGKDITIPKGTEIAAYVNGDMPLDAVKFQAAPAGAAGTAAAAPAQGGNVELEIASTPAGAEIEIDGNFVGSTPSTVGVNAGQHQITVKKAGYRNWERKMTTSSGHIKVAADLERAR
ncbi:MAG: PEGA domain-containing protein [Acidobacteria bacterium]|nr:MAG: PEGA domain-containing protein [Acidobacteriota bacterium]